MFWKKKKSQANVDDVNVMMAKVQALISKNKGDEFLYYFYCATYQFHIYHSETFRINHPDYPWNFGVTNIKIEPREIEIPEDVRENIHYSVKTKKINVVSGVVCNRAFKLYGIIQYQPLKLFISLSFDDAVSMCLTYDFGDMRPTFPDKIGLTDYNYLYMPGYTKPQFSINEFHNEMKPLEFLKSASQEIDKLVKRQNANHEQSLEEGRKIADAEKRKKITF